MKAMLAPLVYLATVFSIAGLFQIANAPTSFAAPNPDSCFTTTGTTSRTITGYNPAGAGCGLAVEIPSTISGGTVVAVGDYSFYNDQITSLIIPSTVTSIGFEAFGSNKLTSVNIPSSVTTLGTSAFRNNLLTSVTIPNSVTNLPAGVFSSNKLASVTIPTSVTTIGMIAFSFNLLTSVSLPPAVTSIGNSAFEGNYITSVTIPNSVTNIGEQAFAQNKISKVTLPNTVTSIGDYTFYLQSAVGRDFYDIIGGGDPEDSQAAVDGIMYVQLFTQDPSNPNGLLDSIVYDTAELDGLDNDYNEFFIAGGYIVNPTTAELQFMDTTTNQLLDPVVLTGQTPTSSTYFYDYIAVNGPSVPTPASPYSPTPLEIQAIRQALAQYYRGGSTLSYTAASVNGIPPTPNSYNFVLSATADDNKRQFVYGVTTPSTGQLAETGMSEWLVVGMAIVIITGSVGILTRK